MSVFTRADYLAAPDREAQRIAHRRYYAQLVTPRTIDIVRRHIGLKALLASTDEHLNDIPLARWDAINDAIRSSRNVVIYRQLGNTGGWSISDGTCLAKEAARQIIETEKGDA